MNGADTPGAMAEFRGGWRVVGGAAAGVGLGIAGLLTYNLGLFADGMMRDFGLSRTMYGAGFFGSTLALALAMPLVGRMVDRFGPRLAAATGAVALAVGLSLLSLASSVAMFLLVLVLIGFIAAPSAPVPHTRAVAAAFRKSRGLALGLTQMGIGLAAALVPPIVAMQVATDGWRSGALLLAGLALAGVVPVMLGLPARSPTAESDRTTAQDAYLAIRGSAAYRLQMAAFTAMALAFAGMLSHFVPLLTQSGMPVQQAGALAGLIGISVIGTRILVGWLSDRMDPAWLGVASCAICAAGCLCLALGGVAAAPVAALALGAAMGAEADLIGIMTARNFPILAYARAYAAQYAAFMVAAGISPLWIGALADATGGYRLSTLVVAAALIVPIALFIRLSRTSRPSSD